MPAQDRSAEKEPWWLSAAEIALWAWVWIVAALLLAPAVLFITAFKMAGWLDRTFGDE